MRTLYCQSIRKSDSAICLLRVPLALAVTFFYILSISSTPAVASGLAQAAIPLLFDQVVTGTIGAPGQVVEYSFSATAGDRLLVRIFDTAGSTFYPQFRVYRPNGSALCSTWNYDYAELQCTLDASGTHTILVGDYGGNDTGSYALYIQRTNNPANPISIPFDSTLLGTINPALDMNAYTFSATAGDRLLVRILDTAGSTFYPQFRVYRPNGSALCSTWNYDYAELQCTLDASGTHTILVGDYGGNDTGSYALYIQRTNNPANPIPIACGQTLTGVINPSLDMNAYTFSGTTGDAVQIGLRDTLGAAFYPQFRVYRPNGSALCSTWNYDYAELECTLDASGTHTILVDDYGGNDTGSYALSFECGSSSPSADLSLTKSDSPDPVVVGATLTYQLIVADNGPAQATGVTLTDSLLGSAAFVSATPSQGTCARTGNTVTCNLGSLASGASATIAIKVTPATAGTVSNTASVTGDQTDPNMANNTDTEATTVNGSACAPTLRSAGSGDWNTAATWNLNRVPNSGDVVLIQAGHAVVGPGFAQVRGLCNYGVIQSRRNQLLRITATGPISNFGQILGSDGGQGVGNSCGRPGSSLQLRGSPVYNQGTIQAGAGGDGVQRGGAGGSAVVVGRNTTNQGTICAGKGGDVLGSAQGRGGGGGATFIWGDYHGAGSLINRGLACGGAGGDGHPGATAPQRGGDGGCVWLMASRDVILDGGRQHGGRGGFGTGGGADGRKGCVVIEPTTISLAGNGTEVSGGDITIFGGDDWVLNLSQLDDVAISATGDITLAVGSGGAVDLSGNTHPVLQAGGQVVVASDVLSLETGIGLADVVEAPNVTAGPGRVLYAVSLAGPGQATARPGVTLPISLTVFNGGPVADTYTLSWSDSAGWSLGTLPASLAIDGLGLSDLALDITAPAAATSGEVDVITITATSQADPSVVGVAQVEVAVETGETKVHLPMIVKQ